MDPNEVILDSQSMQNMRSLFRHTPMIQMCRNTIQKHLLSNGVAIKSGKRSRDESMRPFLDEWWVPFCADAIDAVICFGFVPYTIKTLKTKQKIPVVLLDDTYTIRFKNVDNVFQYRVFGSHDNEPLEDTYVYDEFGFIPRVNGMISSLMESLAPIITNVAVMTQSAVEMEALRRRPLLYMELNDTRARSGDQEGIDYDFYADADMADAEQAARFNRNEKQLEQLEHQQQLLDDFHKASRITDFQHEALSSVTSLPEGARLTTVNQNSGRTDLASLTKSMEDNICGVFGVPRSMLMSDTPHKADTEGTHRQFQQTISWWSDRLSACCEHIYNKINETEVKQKVMERASKRLKRTPMDLYSITKQLQVRFSFPITPLLTRADLKDMYHEGLLDWEQYFVMTMTTMGLAYDTIPEEPQQQPQEQEKKKEDKQQEREKKKEDTSGEQEKKKEDN